MANPPAARRRCMASPARVPGPRRRCMASPACSTTAARRPCALRRPVGECMANPPAARRRCMASPARVPGPRRRCMASPACSTTAARWPCGLRRPVGECMANPPAQLGSPAPAEGAWPVRPLPAPAEGAWPVRPWPVRPAPGQSAPGAKPEPSAWTAHAEGCAGACESTKEGRCRAASAARPDVRAGASVERERRHQRLCASAHMCISGWGSSHRHSSDGRAPRSAPGSARRDPGVWRVFATTWRLFQSRRAGSTLQ